MNGRMELKIRLVSRLGGMGGGILRPPLVVTEPLRSRP